MKTIKRSILALALALSVLLSGCHLTTFSERIEQLESMLEPTQHPTEFEKPDSQGNTPQYDSSDNKPDTSEEHPYQQYIPYEEFERTYSPYEEQVPFSQMEYIPPEGDPICKGYEDVQAMVEKGEATTEEIIDAYCKVFEEHLFFDTMHSLSYVRYSLDLNNTYYDDEYNRCEELSPLLNQAQEKCYVAMSGSPLRDELEEEYFGEDFFLFYDENRIYSKDSVVALMQEESAIESKYLALQNEPTILWKGKETSLDSLLEDPSLPYEDYLQVYEAYYNKYNTQAADLFAQLIRVRKDIAKELGYASYGDFAYSYLYERDYNSAQVAEYCDEIADEMVGILFPAIMAQGELPGKDVNDTLKLFRDTVNSFGGVMQTAYEFMVDYELWDTGISPSKLPGSYMTYLNSYEMPFLYASPNESLDDLMTLCHEFGHFVDGYVNCGGFSGIDCAEVFSQGLEYLALSQADLNPRERSTLIRSKAADSVLVFLTQACYTEFENLAYSLPDEKLNAEGLNELFSQCNQKYGMSLLYMGMEELLAPGWIDVQHFFIAPYYVISYCVSNDVALQIYQYELAGGDGLELYYEMLCQPTDSTILELASSVSLESPFAEGRIIKLADFLADQLG